MSVTFTQHATDRLQERAVRRTDVDRLLGILESIADMPGRLESSPDVTLLRQSGDAAVYLVFAGSLRAVLMADTSQNSIVVANVYSPDEEGFGGSPYARQEAIVSARPAP